jgi:hypothetical protein
MVHAIEVLPEPGWICISGTDYAGTSLISGWLDM